LIGHKKNRGLSAKWERVLSYNDAQVTGNMTQRLPDKMTERLYCMSGNRKVASMGSTAGGVVIGTMIEEL